MAYSDLEKEQIQFIRERYTHFILQGDPLRENEKFGTQEEQRHILVRWMFSSTLTDAKNPAKRHSFRPTTWTTGLAHGGVLFRFSESLIHLICQYQQTRSEARIDHGELGDPTNLLFEELKQWAVHISGIAITETGSPETSLLGELKRRIQYIKSLEDSTIFPKGFLTKTATSFTLCRVRYILIEMVDKVETTLKNQSAREEMGNLCNYIEVLIEHSIQFIYCILNDSGKLTVDGTTKHLLDPINPELKEYMQTTAGKCLTVLIQATQDRTEEPIASAGNGHMPQIADRQLPLLVSTVTNQGNMLVTIPILEALKDPSNRHSGINPLFRENTEPQKIDAIEVYIQLFQLVLELVEFLRYAQSGAGLAGKAGDLLIYGHASDTTMDLMDGFIRLKALMEQAFKTLTKIADIKYCKLLEAGYDHEHIWIGYYRVATTTLEYLRIDLTNCTNLARKIYEKAATSLSAAEQVQNIKEETAGYMRNVNNFSARMSTLYARASGLAKPREIIQLAPKKPLTIAEPSTDSSVEVSPPPASLGIFSASRKSKTILFIQEQLTAYASSNGYAFQLVGLPASIQLPINTLHPYELRKPLEPRARHIDRIRWMLNIFTLLSQNTLGESEYSEIRKLIETRTEIKSVQMDDKLDDFETVLEKIEEAISPSFSCRREICQ